MPTYDNAPEGTTIDDADRIVLSQGPLHSGVSRRFTVGNLTGHLSVGAIGFTPINKAGDSGIAALSLADTLDVAGATTLAGAVAVSASGIAADFSGTGALRVNRGSTAQRPDTGSAGNIRWNSTTSRYEFGVGSAWKNHVLLDGDTMTGALNLSAAGTALAVTNNATVGGTLGVNGTATLASGSTSYVTVVGSGSAAPTVSAAGTGNVQLLLRSLGSGGNAAINIGSTAGGGALQVVGNSTTGSGLLRLTQATSATTQMTMTMLTNTQGVKWTDVPTQFSRSWSYSGASTDFVNRPFSVNNSITGGQYGDVTGLQPIVGITTSYTNFMSGGIGSRGLQVWSQILGGTTGPNFNAATVQVSQEAQPGVLTDVPVWASSTSYPTIGRMVRNGSSGPTRTYRLITAGTSASSGGPTTTAASITDGTCVWSYQGPAHEIGEQIAFNATSTVSYNLGGVSGAPVGNAWGAVIGSQSGAGATFYTASVALEVDDYFQGSANRNATIQVVRGPNSNQGINQDWGISISAASAPAANRYRNALLFQDAVDQNGYAIAFQNQNQGGLQTMAGALDMRLVNATGNGRLGGGFTIRGSNWQFGNAGDLNLRYSSFTPTSSGVTIDVTNSELTALAITGGGTNWTAGQEWVGSDGSYGTVATLSGTAIATVTIVRPSVLGGSLPGSVTLYPASDGGITGATGLQVTPTSATATPTYAAASTPTISIGTGSATAINIGNSGAVVTISGPLSTLAPVTKTSNFTMGAAETAVICNGSGTITVTLPAAASFSGQWRRIKTIAAQTVVSASSNVVPLIGGSAGTAILAATAGKWANLQSDGTNWIIMEGN